MLIALGLFFFSVDSVAASGVALKMKIAIEMTALHTVAESQKLDRH